MGSPLQPQGVLHAATAVLQGGGGLQPRFQERLVWMNVVAAVPVFVLGSPCMHGWVLIGLRGTIVFFVMGQLLGRLLLKRQFAAHVAVFRCSICCINFGTWMLSYWWCLGQALWYPFMVFAHLVTGIWVKLLCGSFTKHQCAVSVAGNVLAYVCRVGASKEPQRGSRGSSWMLQWCTLCASLLLGLCAIGVLNFAGVRRKLLLLWRVVNTPVTQLESDPGVAAATPPWLAAKESGVVAPVHRQSSKSRNRSLAGLRANHSDLEGVVFDRLVGRGSFGRVYKGSWLGTNVAVKVIPWTSSKDNAGPIFEAQLAAKLSHPCLVQTFKHSTGVRNEVTEVQETWIVQEWCDLGTLGQLCSEPLPAWEVVEMAQDVASGGAYLHSCRIIHGDLNANNVLLKSTQAPGKGYVCKVCDFGLARVLNADRTYLLTSQLGTVTHMPPEAFSTEGPTFRLTKSADVYAFGMLLFQAVAGRPPFDGLTGAQVVVQVESGARVELPQSADERLRRIFDQCTSPAMDQRPTFHDLVPNFQRLADSEDL